MTLPIEISHLINNNEIDAAIVAVTRLLEDGGGDPELYYQRGRLYWRKDMRREAINDYMEAVSLDPSSKAAAALEQASAIMRFYDRNRYNP